MGVPRFYRWLSERYPLINRKIGSDPRFLPHFDNFYLDLNGIIHNCSHPDDTADHLSKLLTFETICANIEVLIDKMVQTVRPRRVLYIAIDGCAPRAKLNQQRSRRFATARNIQKIKDNQRKARGDSDIEVEESFDSNVITPGTEFMANLDSFLQSYIARKIEKDPVWRSLTVIYSGHNVPGEGEHKIMEFIRSERRKPDYDPNTRHCCNSLDADLIMLGLASHEPRFCLLREEVDFTGGMDPKGSLKTKMFSALTTDLEKWELLDLSTLRQYLKIEFESYHHAMKQNLEHKNIKSPCIERIIDDIIVLVSVIGNDFLPHLPGVEIRVGSLDKILMLYKRILYENIPDFNFIVSNTGETLNIQNICKIFQALAEDEVKHFEGRSSKKKKRSQRKAEASTVSSYKSHYYERNFDVDFKTGRNIDSIDKACTEFVHGLVWCFRYYYFGIPSWDWFYPFHYAPLASDLINFQRLGHSSNMVASKQLSDSTRLMNALHSKKPADKQDSASFFKDQQQLSPEEQISIAGKLHEFNLGEPLVPFLQLMCCLPPQSAHALPEPYARLMTNENSSLKRFYPKEFKIDLNGKRFEYEGVNLIPFVDIKEISKVVSATIQHFKFSEFDKTRNSFGKTLLFRYCKEIAAVKETVPSIPSRVKGIIHDLKNPDFVKEGNFPGDPRLNGLNCQFKKCGLDFISLNIFGRPSREETFVLNISMHNEVHDYVSELQKRKNSSGDEDDYMTIDNLAAYCNSLVQKARFRKVRCWVNYPYFIEAEVVGIFNKDTRYVFKTSGGARLSHSPQAGFVRDTAYSRGINNFEIISDKITHSLHFGAKSVGTGGIQLEDDYFDFFVEVVPKTNISYDYRKQGFFDIFGGKKIVLPFQLVAFKNPAIDEKLKASYYNKLLKTEKLYEKVLQEQYGQQKFMILTDQAGCYGSVGNIVSETANEYIIELSMPSAAHQKILRNCGNNILKNVKDVYFSTYAISQKLGISNSAIGKIASSVMIMPGHFDIGLNLKGGKLYKTPGYTRGGNNYARRVGNDSWRDRTHSKRINGFVSNIFEDRRYTKGTDELKTKPMQSLYWEYSTRALEVLTQYKNNFPHLFHYLHQHEDQFEYSLDSIYPAGTINDEGEEMHLSRESRLDNLKQFLKSLDCYNIPLVPTKSDFANESVRKALMYSTKKCLTGFETKQIKVPKKSGVLLTAIKCQLWFDSPTSSTVPRLCDRVTNMAYQNISFGKQGFIVATHPITKCVEVLFDDSTKRVLRYSQVVNLSQPRYINYSKSLQPGTVNSTSRRNFAETVKADQVKDYDSVDALMASMQADLTLKTLSARNSSVSNGAKIKSNASTRHQAQAQQPKLLKKPPSKQRKGPYGIKNNNKRSNNPGPKSSSKHNDDNEVPIAVQEVDSVPIPSSKLKDSYHVALDMLADVVGDKQNNDRTKTDRLKASLGLLAKGNGRQQALQRPKSSQNGDSFPTMQTHVRILQKPKSASRTADAAKSEETRLPRTNGKSVVERVRGKSTGDKNIKKKSEKKSSQPKTYAIKVNKGEDLSEMGVLKLMKTAKK